MTIEKIQKFLDNLSEEWKKEFEIFFDKVIDLFEQFMEGDPAYSTLVLKTFFERVVEKCIEDPQLLNILDRTDLFGEYQ